MCIQSIVLIWFGLLWVIWNYICIHGSERRKRSESPRYRDDRRDLVSSPITFLHFWKETKKKRHRTSFQGTRSFDIKINIDYLSFLVLVLRVIILVLILDVVISSLVSCLLLSRPSNGRVFIIGSAFMSIFFDLRWI